MYKDKRTEYLGYCIEKGHVYSVEVAQHVYHIISIKDNYTSTLITYTVKGK